eukprot:gnl/TRDRNA2_/TRDRNA2_82614_c0_seq2.p1 gnl/TRDRNA2_/TRDRNA2_82614_c0~~gnl/TRDRNA2_/TRDRNA2_82614_c0_seq2.p1  ORF type:complete len:142 (-),score=10.26 gnl/TRDRNA2_/TRDRNA2_82614_c0_seq2:36-461(-)
MTFKFCAYRINKFWRPLKEEELSNSTAYITPANSSIPTSIPTSTWTSDSKSSFNMSDYRPGRVYVSGGSASINPEAEGAEPELLGRSQLCEGCLSPQENGPLLTVLLLLGGGCLAKVMLSWAGKQRTNGQHSQHSGYILLA